MDDGRPRSSVAEPPFHVNFLSDRACFAAAEYSRRIVAFPVEDAVCVPILICNHAGSPGETLVSGAVISVQFPVTPPLPHSYLSGKRIVAYEGRLISIPIKLAVSIPPSLSNDLIVFSVSDNFNMK
jgi:hypothetical protein